MKLLHDERRYPPNLSIMAHSDVKQTAIVNIEVRGIKITGSPNVLSLKIPVNFDGLIGSSALPEAAVAEVLGMASHFNILFTTLHKRVSFRWEDIASYLDVDPAIVELINNERGNDVNSCFREMLKEWLQQTHSPPYKSKLLQALRDLNFAEEANQLDIKLSHH